MHPAASISETITTKGKPVERAIAKALLRDRVENAAEDNRLCRVHTPTKGVKNELGEALSDRRTERKPKAQPILRDGTQPL